MEKFLAKRIVEGKLRYVDVPQTLRAGVLAELEAQGKGYLAGVDTEVSGTGAELWEDIQQSGLRKDYSYAFANWNLGSINPKYTDIIADSVIFMFVNSASLTRCDNLNITVKKSNASIQGICQNCPELLIGPHFKFTSSNDTGVVAVRNMISAYAGCEKLTTAYVYWGNGKQDVVKDRTNCQNMFLKCSELTSITFEGSGSPSGLDLSKSSKITKATLQSLAKSLQNAKGKTGIFKIKVSADTYNLLTAAEITALFTNKGWTLSK